MKTSYIKQYLRHGILCFCTAVALPALTACSDNDDSGDPAKDWAGTTTAYASSDEQGFQTFYTPSVGRVGDPMPFYDQRNGEFKVLYLQEFINNLPFRFHPIWGVTTKDGAHYQSIGEVLPYASNDYQQDAALGTGCAYEKDGTYYIYYTGHNGNCQNREVVLRATSTDFKNWTKDELWALNGPDYLYLPRRRWRSLLCRVQIGRHEDVGTRWTLQDDLGPHARMPRHLQDGRLLVYRVQRELSRQLEP